MDVYSIDLKLAASLFVKANSATEAYDKIRTWVAHHEGIELTPDGELISERPFDDPALPECSLSPAVTCHGVWDDFEEGPRLEQTGVPE